MSETKKSKKRVLFLVNHEVVIYNFRLEIVERLLADGHEVHISSPYGERIDELTALGAKYHEIVISRHGLNPVSELNLLRDEENSFLKFGGDFFAGGSRLNCGCAFNLRRGKFDYTRCEINRRDVRVTNGTAWSKHERLRLGQRTAPLQLQCLLCKRLKYENKECTSSFFVYTDRKTAIART